MPEPERRRILTDRATPHLATVLADAASRGADPGSLLVKAYEYDDLSNVRSPALVLATRIQDYARTFGVPEQAPVDRPLPWLPGPTSDTKPGRPYLAERARLIAERAGELGSTAAAYREQYNIADPNGLGEEPAPETARSRAYRIAGRSTRRAASPQHRAPRARRPRRRPEDPVRTVTSPSQGPRLGL